MSQSGATSRTKQSWHLGLLACSLPGLALPLMEERTVILNGEVTDRRAGEVIGRILELEALKNTGDICLCLDSPGGQVTAGLGIYDTMQFTTCDVVTVCLGNAASIAAVLLAAGAPGKRIALSHARVSFHSPWGELRQSGAGGPSQLEVMIRLKASLNKIICRHTGQSFEVVQQGIDHGISMTPAQAKVYGLIDHIAPTRERRPSGRIQTATQLLGI